MSAQNLCPSCPTWWTAVPSAHCAACGRRAPARGAHRPETLGRHAVTVHQIRANAAIADMYRITQDGRADLQVVRA